MFDAVSEKLKSVEDENFHLSSQVANLEKKLSKAISKSSSNFISQPGFLSYQGSTKHQPVKIKIEADGPRLKPFASHVSDRNLSSRNATLTSRAYRTSRSNTAVASDPCEVFVSGLPHLPKLKTDQVVRQILAFSNLTSFLSQVISTRN